VAVYFPAGGAATLDLPQDVGYSARWFDPRTGDVSDAAPSRVAEGTNGRPAFETPGGEDGKGHPLDWVLVLSMHQDELP